MLITYREKELQVNIKNEKAMKWFMAMPKYMLTHLV